MTYNRPFSAHLPASPRLGWCGRRGECLTTHLTISQPPPHPEIPRRTTDITAHPAILIVVLEETDYTLDVDRNEVIAQLADICVTPTGGSYTAEQLHSMTTEQIAEVLANAWGHRWELGDVELSEWFEHLEEESTLHGETQGANYHFVPVLTNDNPRSAAYPDGVNTLLGTAADPDDLVETIAGDPEVMASLTEAIAAKVRALKTRP